MKTTSENCRVHQIVTIFAFAVVLLAGSHSQAALNVLNPSFESPDISPDFFSFAVPTDWDVIDPSDSRRIIKGDHVETINGLTPFGMTGVQFAIIGAGRTGGDGSGTGTDLFQNIGTTDGLSDVTLTVDTAHRRDWPLQGGIQPGDITIGIWQDTDADSIPDLALQTLPIPFASQTDTFLPKVVAALGVPGGTELYVRFTAADSPGTPEGFRQTLLDNVQIQSVVIPEPHAVFLFGFGAIALGMLRLRRRK